jgi:hypothetical protein
MDSIKYKEYKKQMKTDFLKYKWKSKYYKKIWIILNNLEIL